MEQHNQRFSKISLLDLSTSSHKNPYPLQNWDSWIKFPIIRALPKKNWGVKISLLRGAENSLRRSFRLLSSCLKFFGVFSLLGMDLLRANPLGEQVVAGAAGFERGGNALTVTQGTDRAIINWNSFSIGAGEITRFIQPNSSSAVLNRVITASNPSQIYGALQANGQVYLINPAGVFVGPGGVVDTASFVASTRDIANDEFMRGGNLNFTGSSDAAILNQGKIDARQGDVFLVARQVSNEGQIMASDGTVGLVSGTEVCLQALGPHSYKVRLLDVADGSVVRKAADGVAEVINQGVIEAANAELEATGNYLSMAIRNTGTIRATGVRPNADGSVTLTGGEGDVLNQGVVAALRKNVEGKTVGGDISVAAKNITLDPGSIVTAAGEEKGGKIAIDAKDTILAGGKIAAGSGKGKGGDIVVTGERVGLVKAEVDASGATGGGQVLVGGDYLGSNPNVRNAKATVMTSDSVIRANATDRGDGGKVILWSDEYTGFYGEIFARGGLQGGDGGFVETSSSLNLQAWGQADVFAPAGKTGTWLLDPYDVYIVETSAGLDPAIYPAVPGTRPITDLFTANVANAQISVSRILFALNDGQNVIIRTGPQPTDGLSPGAPGASPATQPFTQRPTGGSGNIVVTVPIQAEVGSTGSLTLENLWVIKELQSLDDLPTKGGSIIINDNCPITVGGSLTLTAGGHLGSMPFTLSRARLTIGGEGGDVVIGSNSPIYAANGLVTITAGLSLATGSGGVGGDVIINSSIYAGRGINIAGGDVDRGWNWNNFTETLPFQDFVATTPLPANNATVFDLNTSGTGYLGTSRQIPAGSYLIQGVQSLGTTTAPPGPPTPTSTFYTQLSTRNGVVPGDVTIASGAVFYLGQNSVSRIRAGNAGNNQGIGTGDLTIGNSILALGNNVSLVLASGNGVTPGNLTISAPLGAAQSGNTFNYRNNNFSPNSTAFSSTALRRITLQSGSTITIGATVRAETAEIMNITPQNSLWLNHNEITGSFACRVTSGSLNNLIGVSLVGTPTLVLGTTPNEYFSDEIDPLTLLPGNKNISNFGDISFSQAGPINFAFSRVNVVGKGTAVSFDYIPTVSGASAVTLPAGGTLSFNTQGEVYTNYQNSQFPNVTAVTISGGTVDFANVAAPGNNPSQGPQTGIMILDVANIQGASVMGPSFIRTVGNVSLGNLSTVVGRPDQTTVTVTSATGRTATISTLPPVLGIPNNPGDFSLASAGSVTLSGNVTVQGGARNLNITGVGGINQTGGVITAQNIAFGPNTAVFGSSFGTSGAINQSGGRITANGISTFNGGTGTISLTQSANDFIGAVILASSAANSAAVSITDANALTLAAPVLGANSGISAVAGTVLTLPNAAISTGAGNINLRSNGGALATANSLTTSSGAITLVGSTGITLGHAISTTLASGNGGSLTLTSASGAVNQTGGSLVIQGATQATASLANQSITLAQAANDFTGAVNLTTAAGGNISIRDANALNIGGINMGTSGFPGAGSLTLAVGTALTQSGVINTGTGGVTINATAAGTDINLASFANSIRAANITFTNPNNVRDYGIRTAFATADADAGLGGTPLPNLRNLTVLYDAAAINLPALTLATSGGQAGNLVLSSGNVAGVLQGGAWGVPGTTQVTTTLANAPITLTQALNDFTGAVSLTTAAGGNISIRDANALNIGAINMGTSGAPGAGTLTLAVGTALTQTGVINTGTGGVTINTTAAGADINLASFANSIQAANITFTTPANVRDYGIRTTFATADADAGLGGTPLPNLRNLTVLYDAAAINLPALTLATSGGQAGSLALSSGNLLGVLQGGAWVVPGTTQVTTTLANAPITLNNAGNNFTGAVGLSSAAGGNVGITDGTGGLTLGTLAVGGNLAAISTAAGGALNLGSGTVSGTVGATTNDGQINQTGALNLQGGLVTLTAGTGVINLGTAGNQISFIRIFNSGNATLRSSTSLDFASAVSTISGNLTVTAGGITDSAQVVVTGNTLLNSGTEAILLDNETNLYGTGLSVSGSGSATLFVPLTNESILGAVNSTGEFVLRTDSGTGFNFPSAGGTGDFDLTTVQLQGFNVGTFTPQARGGAGLTLGAFTSSLFPGISGLKLVTTGGGAILGNGPITTGAFSFNSSGTSTFNGAITASSVSFGSTGAVAFNNTVAATDAFTFNTSSSATFTKAVSARSMDFTSTGPMSFNETVAVTEGFSFNSGNSATFAGPISARTLGFTSTGAVQFGGVNAVQNLGTFSVSSSAPLSFQNNQSLNLTGTGSSGGRLSMQVAGYFNNVTGQENPLASVAGGSVIQSLSLFGPSLSQLYGLAGFSTRFDGSMPTSGNVMSYVISPLNFVVPAGTTIAGVNLGGLPQAGQQMNTFETGSNDLNWIVSDFASFNLPQVPRAVMEYTLYPQRVETETRTLPESTLGQLRRELGRPPTVEEVQAREVATRDAVRVREGAILERSSFDAPEETEGRYQEAKEGVAPSEGGTPQADVRSVPPTDHSAGFLDSQSSPPQANGQRKKEGEGSGDSLGDQRSSKVCLETSAKETGTKVLASK